MRIKLLHHTSEWLPGDYEAPAGRTGEKHLTAWRLHRDGDRIGLALSAPRGATAWGVWTSAGKLLHYVEQGADLAFVPQGILSLEQGFIRPTGAPGRLHRIRRLDGATFEPRAEGKVHVRTGSARYLVVDHRSTRALATWRDQTEWGYVVIDAVTLEQSKVSVEWPLATLPAPAFSPDDAVVVSCNYFSHVWWAPDHDDWYGKSPGGDFKMGSISVHDLASNAITHHDVVARLPAGWAPKAPEEDEWQMIWGPEFVSDRAFRIWLPDGSEEVLSLPLPVAVRIDRPLATDRA